MLNRENIIEIVNRLNLPQHDYWLVTGAALVLHGVKQETRDIDMGCTKELANKLVSAGRRYIINNDGNRIIKMDNEIEVYEAWTVEQIEIIDGISTGSIESIRQQKMKLGREKDWNDIKLIELFYEIKKSESKK